MRVALIGESSSGKTTLFCALSGIDYHRAIATAVPSAIVKVMDPRLQTIFNKGDGSQKIVTPLMEILDTRSLLFEGDTQQNKVILATLRECDGLVATLRFDDASAADGAILDAAIDKGIARFRSELYLADMEIIQKRIEKLQGQSKRPMPPKEKEEDALELQGLETVMAHLLKEDISIFASMTHEMERKLRGFQFLSKKPLYVVVNLAEQIWKPGRALPRSVLAEFPFPLEHELLQMEGDDRASFMKEYGISRLSVEDLPRKIYYAMGRMIFITTGKKDVTGWEIPQGATAYDAAGRIHTDIQKGFICAEVLGYGDWLQYGSFSAASAHARVKTAGKTHVMQDGDIIEIKFNVS